jgi:predicted DNA-binding transcriptional regulator YafY
MAKSDYMLAIVWLLRSRGRMTASDLANTLEISVRSVYRYIDSLCASGVPILAESGHEGGYELLPNYQAVPLFFTTDEKKALAHSALFAQKAGYPFTDALTSALRKIQYGSTTEQIEELSLHTEGIDVLATANHSAYTSVIADLEQAVAYGQTVRITYHKPKSGERTVREIDPYGLVHWRERWYCVAYCHLRQDIRKFRVDRIDEYSLTSSTFVRPEDFSVESFFLRRRTADGEGGALSVVVLTGDEAAIHSLVNHWLLGSCIVSQTEEKVQLLIEQTILEKFLPRFLLSFGQSLQILGPDSLRARMVTLTEELCQYYRKLH